MSGSVNSSGSAASSSFDSKPLRVPPSSSSYSFTFTCPRTVDVEVDGKNVVYYEYEVTIKRGEKTHEYGGEGNVKFRKRWSELDAFDADWAQRIGKEGDSNPLHDEIRLDPFGLSKYLKGPLSSSSSLKPKRQLRFVEYINACMSEGKMHRELARFLGVPLEILAPPTKGSEEEGGKGGKNGAKGGTGGATADADDDAPLHYTRRKIKPKAKRCTADSDDEDGPYDLVPSPAAASSPAGASASVVEKSAGKAVTPADSGASGSGAASPGGARSSPLTTTPIKQIKVPSQYLKDSVTPNPKWPGPLPGDWFRLQSLPLLKLPHATGFLGGKAKVRKFGFFPLQHEKAQALIKAAKKEEKKKPGFSFFDGLEEKAWVLMYDSSKDALESIFILGDPNIPWSVFYDQSEGQFSKQKKDEKTGKTMYSDQAALSLTIRYRDGSQLRTLDLIAEKEEDYLLLKKALTYIQWVEQQKIPGATQYPEGPAAVMSPTNTPFTSPVRK
jgi:hypothetical protein